MGFVRIVFASSRLDRIWLGMFLWGSGGRLCRRIVLMALLLCCRLSPFLLRLLLSLEYLSEARKSSENMLEKLWRQIRGALRVYGDVSGSVA